MVSHGRTYPGFKFAVSLRVRDLSPNDSRPERERAVCRFGEWMFLEVRQCWYVYHCISYLDIEYIDEDFYIVICIFILYIYIHTLFVIWDATFGGHQFESLIAWTRPFISYKDVENKYYKLPSTEIREDIAMSHKTGLRSGQVLILSTCKCVCNFRIYLCLSCIHISQGIALYYA